MYDLFQFQQRPFDRDLVRTLAVLKCWLVGDTFDPDRFFANIQSGRYEWEDLARLIRKACPELVEGIAAPRPRR